MPFCTNCGMVLGQGVPCPSCTPEMETVVRPREISPAKERWDLLTKIIVALVLLIILVPLLILLISRLPRPEPVNYASRFPVNTATPPMVSVATTPAPTIEPTPPPTPRPTPRAKPHVLLELLGNDVAVIEPGRWMWWTVTLDTPSQVTGTWASRCPQCPVQTATIYVVDEDEVNNLTGGGAARIYFRSPEVLDGKIDLKLAAGRYCIVFRSTAILYRRFISCRFTAQPL